MNMIFAYDAPKDDAATDVQNWMHSEPSVRHWALVDVALVGAEKFISAAHRQQWSPMNALANTPLEAFGDVAPRLIEVSVVPQQRKAQIDQLLQLTAGAPALSFLRSVYPDRSLQMVFDYLAIAQIQDRPRAVHLRFADTRVLAGLLEMLSPNQQQRVTHIVRDWRWFDRSGQWQSWSIKPTSAALTEMDSQTHLHLSGSQFSQLLDQAEADGFFQRLTLEHPTLVLTQQRMEFHQRLTAALSIASELMLRNEEERWLFVLLSLSYGDGFHHCEALNPTWKAVREEGVGLEAQIHSWGSEILTALNNYKANQ